MAKTDIKTVAKKNIRTIETVGIITEKVKDAGIKTKDDIGKAIHTDADTPEQYAAQRFQDTVHSTATDTAYYFNKAGKKSVADTKKNIENAQVTLEDIKARRAERKAKAKSAEQANQNIIKNVENAPKKPSETAMKNAPKTAGNDIRMGNNSVLKNKGKTIKTANDNFTQSVRTADSAKNTFAVKRLAVSKNAEKARKAAQYMRETAKEAAKLAKNSFKVLMKVIKGAIKAAESLVSAIIAGGWISVIVIIILCLVGALASSFYGIFFSTETSDSGMNISSVIQEINADYDNRIDELKSDEYDRIEINGSKANWKDVLSIYAVKTTTDPDNPMEIATVDENKKSILSTIFWDMNSIDSKAETRTETKEITSTDENGNEIITTDEITVKILTITISSKNADDMSKQYSFDDKQKEYLAELMNDSNDKLWASIIFSTGGNTNVDIDFDALDFGDETVNDTQRKIVAVATNSESYGISAKSGYCQAWVADVYQAVTGSRGSAHCALCAADMWAVSQDFSKIQVGATVYGYSSSQFGHVGIYIGNGKVIHNLSGTVKVQSLKSWVKDFKGFAWGWENGENLI